MMVREVFKSYQIRCLLKAQDDLAKARSSDLPVEVAREVQSMMSKIPRLINRLETGSRA